MGFRSRWVITVVVAAAAAGGWAWRDRTGGSIADLLASVISATRAAPTPAAAPAGDRRGGGAAAAVETVQARVGRSVRSVRAVGTLISNESVVIRPEVAGRVSEILFQEGTRVTRGTPLIRLDDAVARANLAQAQANLVFSAADAQRAEELFRQGTGPAKAREQAVAKFRSDDASVQLYKAQLDRMTLVAPFDGVVGTRLVSIGDMVTVGKDLVNLEQIDTLKLDLRVPETHLPEIKVGQPLELTVDAFGDRAFQGEIFALDPLIDVNGRALKLRARVPNTDGALRPGLFARVTLTLSVVPDAVMIPEQAVTPVGRDMVVFTLVDGKAKANKVVLGEREGGEVRVVDGIRATDRVITAGQSRLRDGAPVRVADAKPARDGARGEGGAR